MTSGTQHDTRTRAADDRPAGWPGRRAVLVSVVVFVALVGSLAGVAGAGTTVVGFEEYEEGTELTTQYRDDGVVFGELRDESAGAIVRTCNGRDPDCAAARNGHHAIITPDAIELFRGPLTATFTEQQEVERRPLVATFTEPQREVRLYVRETRGREGPQVAALVARDASGSVVAETTVPFDNGTGWHRISVSTESAGISEITLTLADSDEVEDPHNHFVVDDLSFVRNEPPKAAFDSPPDDPSVDEPVRFDASKSFDPDGEIVEYRWYFDEDDTIDRVSSIPFASYTYDEPGKYTVVLEVVDDDGVVRQTEGTIQVTGPPEPRFDAPIDVRTTGTRVTFDASESLDPDGEIVEYRWDFDGDGTFDHRSSFRSASYTYDEPGEYTVVLEVVDDDGVVRRTERTIRVQEPMLPFDGADLILAGIGGILGLKTIRRTRSRLDGENGQDRPPEAKIQCAPDEPAIGRPVLIDGSASVAPDPERRIVNYRWTVDGREPTAPRFVTAFLGTGDHDVELEVVDSHAHSTTETETITVEPEEGDLVLDRVHPDAPGDDRENLDREYLVFENAGDGALELDGWTVHDAAEDRDRVVEGEHTFRFPDGFELDPGGTVTIHTGPEPEDAAGRKGRAAERHLFWGKRQAVWNDDEDVVVVEDDGGYPVLAHRYQRTDGGEYDLEKLDVEILEDWFPDVVVSSRDDAPLMNVRFDLESGLAAISGLFWFAVGATFLRGPRAFLGSWADVTGFLGTFLLTWWVSTSMGVVPQSIVPAVPVLSFAGALVMLVAGGVAFLVHYAISGLWVRLT